MHGGSSKIIRNDKDTNWMNLEPCIPLGDCLPCMYQFESDLQPIESLWKKSTWYTKVKQMYEHITYELRYEHLNSIEHGSICMKHNLSNHSYRVVCSHWAWITFS